MSWETLSEFKLNTGLKFDDALLQGALDSAVEQMKHYIFIPRRYQTTDSNTRQILTRFNNPMTAQTSFGTTNPRFLYLADLNADRVVDKNDINCYELASDFTETPRNANITAFNTKYGVIDFNLAVPATSGNVLIVEYAEAKAYLQDIIQELKELNEMLAVNYVFQKIPFAKLQCGIPSWTINGVSVEFSQQVLKAVVDENKQRIKELYNLLVPTYTIFNTMQASTPDVSRRLGNIGFLRSGGGW